MFANSGSETSSWDPFLFGIVHFTCHWETTSSSPDSTSWPAKATFPLLLWPGININQVIIKYIDILCFNTIPKHWPIRIWRSKNLTSFVPRWLHVSRSPLPDELWPLKYINMILFIRIWTDLLSLPLSSWLNRCARYRWVFFLKNDFLFSFPLLLF